MALYADDKFDHPGALVASTASTLVSGGDQKIAPSAEVTLPAGTYWVMGEFDRPTSVWSQTQRTSFPSAWVNHTFGTALLNRFPSPFSYIPDYYPGLHMGNTTSRLSFYVVAQ